MDDFDPSRDAIPVDDDFDPSRDATPAEPEAHAAPAAPAEQPWGSKLGDAIAAGAGHNLLFGLPEKAAAAVKATQLKLEGNPFDWGENYRQGLNNLDQGRRNAEAYHPTATKVAGGVAGLATGLALPPVAKIGSGLGGAMATGATNGALYGYLQGAGQSRAQDFDEVVGDVGLGAVNGALWGAGAGALGYGVGKGLDGTKGLIQRFLASRMNASRQAAAEAAESAAQNAKAIAAPETQTTSRAKELPKGITDEATGPAETGGLESTQVRKARQVGRKGQAIDDAALLNQHGVPASEDDVAARAQLLQQKQYPGLPKPDAAQARVRREASGAPTQILSRDEVARSVGGMEESAPHALSAEQSTNGGPGRTGKPPTDRFADFLASKGDSPAWEPKADFAAYERTGEANPGANLLPGEDPAIRARFDLAKPQPKGLLDGVPSAALKGGLKYGAIGEMLGHGGGGFGAGAIKGAGGQVVENLSDAATRAKVYQYLLQKSGSPGNAANSLPGKFGQAAGALSGGRGDKRQP